MSWCLLDFLLKCSAFDEGPWNVCLIEVWKSFLFLIFVFFIVVIQSFHFFFVLDYGNETEPKENKN